MKKTIFVGLCCLTLVGAVLPTLAADTDPNQCLECHEPAEDWAGLTVLRCGLRPEAWCRRFVRFSCLLSVAGCGWQGL